MDSSHSKYTFSEATPKSLEKGSRAKKRELWFLGLIKLYCVLIYSEGWQPDTTLILKYLANTGYLEHDTVSISLWCRIRPFRTSSRIRLRFMIQGTYLRFHLQSRYWYFTFSFTMYQVKPSLHSFTLHYLRPWRPPSSLCYLGDFVHS